MKRIYVLKGRGFFLILLGLFMGVLVAPMISLALCIMGEDGKMQLFLSPENKTWGNFSGKEDVFPSTVSRCKEDASRYLMLTLGVARSGKQSNLKEVYIFDNYKPEKCELKNSLSILGMMEPLAQEHFSQQYKLLRSCFELKVDDINGLPLVFKENQEHCQIKKSPEGGVTLNGDLCFLKISSRSQFAILPVIKNECRDADYLKKLGLMPQDLEASLDVLVAGDDTGNSMDLTQIGSRPILLNVAPPSKLAKLSEDFGPEMPRFVTDYSADVDWGKVSIRPGKTTQINLSVLASNISDKNCQGDDCFRMSNYVQPVFGQVEVFEMKNSNKPVLIEEWWDGGFAAANWQGFVTGTGYATNEELFTPGKKYRIQMTFQNPTDDFEIYLSGLNQILINLSAMTGGVVGIDVIPGLQTLKQLGVFPPFMGTGGLKGDDQGVNLGQIIKGLSGIISSHVWPTYFEKVCDPTKASCLKLGKQKFYQRLSMEFTAGETDISTGEMSLEDLNLQKESTVFHSYNMTSKAFPEFRCGGN